MNFVFIYLLYKLYSENKNSFSSLQHSSANAHTVLLFELHKLFRKFVNECIILLLAENVGNFLEFTNNISTAAL